MFLKNYTDSEMGLGKNKPLLHRHILKTNGSWEIKFPNHFVLSITRLDTIGLRQIVH